MDADADSVDAKWAVVLGVEYDGSAFRGFQRQAAVETVQGALETAASRVADAPVGMVAAGRTDAGVHATGQVVSFRTNADRSAEAWRRGISSNTPSGIGVVWARVCPPAFHARFNALWRRYVYVLADTPQRPVLHRHLVAWLPRPTAPLDAARMHRAAQALLGEHDFSSFRAAACQSRTPWRRVDALRVGTVGDHVVVDITANAFLLRMVRNIVGALVAVGRCTLPEEHIAKLLRLRQRQAAPPTAPPEGLYLVGVGYPHLPTPVRMPPILGPNWPAEAT